MALSRLLDTTPPRLLPAANACRHICEDRPDLWPRSALQLALFIGRNRKYVRPGDELARWRVDDRGAFLVAQTRAWPKPLDSSNGPWHRSENKRGSPRRLATHAR
jgi:hypothetical protein